jgi:hypothetical protein
MRSYTAVIERDPETGLYVGFWSRSSIGAPTLLDALLDSTRPRPPRVQDLIPAQGSAARRTGVTSQRRGVAFSHSRDPAFRAL